MAEMNTTISYGDLIKKMNEKTAATKSIKLLGENIDIKPTLSMDEFDSVLDSMVGLIYGGSGDYNAAAKDFVVRLCTVFAYTGVHMPDDISEELNGLYDLMYGTEFYDLVCKSINQAQYSALLGALEDEIDKRNNSNIEKVNKQVNALSEMIVGLGEQFKNALGDISEEDVNKLIAAIENNTIDEGKLVKAYSENKYGEDA